MAAVFKRAVTSYHFVQMSTVRRKCTMIKRIGLLTSGGDCQALNATMRGVVKALSNAVDDLEVYGFDD